MYVLLRKNESFKYNIKNFRFLRFFNRLLCNNANRCYLPKLKNVLKIPFWTAPSICISIFFLLHEIINWLLLPKKLYEDLIASRNRRSPTSAAGKMSYFVYFSPWWFSKFSKVVIKINGKILDKCKFLEKFSFLERNWRK